MIKDYYYVFSMERYGNVKITSDHKPTEDEILRALSDEDNISFAMENIEIIPSVHKPIHIEKRG